MQFPGMRAGGLLPCISFVTQLGLYYYPHFSEKENKPQRGSDLPDITQHVAGTHLRWPDTTVHARVPREPGQEQSAVMHAPWENWQRLHTGPLHIRGLSLTRSGQL